MGCDIHMVLERRHNDEWVGVQNFEYIPAAATDDNPIDSVYSVGWKVKGRYYNLFAALAGVRGAGPDPRGVPDDISSLTRMEIDYWGSDGHSHSWGLLEEVLPLFMAYIVPAQIISDERLLTAKRLFGLDACDEIEDYRLIYWFDN